MSNMELIITYITVDGTRNDGDLSRFVRSRGKAGDYIKRLPIANFSLLNEEGLLMQLFSY